MPEAQGERGAVNSDAVARLTVWERQQADAIAGVLLASVGGYRGSETDALTDAVAIMRAARFAPPTGDNHHNAAACPYCSPSSATGGAAGGPDA